MNTLKEYKKTRKFRRMRKKGYVLCINGSEPIADHRNSNHLGHLQVVGTRETMDGVLEIDLACSDEECKLLFGYNPGTWFN